MVSVQVCMTSDIHVRLKILLWPFLKSTICRKHCKNQILYLLWYLYRENSVKPATAFCWGTQFIGFAYLPVMYGDTWIQRGVHTCKSKSLNSWLSEILSQYLMTWKDSQVFPLFLIKISIFFILIIFSALINGSSPFESALVNPELPSASFF